MGVLTYRQEQVSPPDDHIRRQGTLRRLRAGAFASLAEAAKFAGVSKQRVHQWCVIHAIDWQATREIWLAREIAKEDARMAKRGKLTEDRRHKPSMMTPLLRPTRRPKGPSKAEKRNDATDGVAEFLAKGGTIKRV